ncbi:MAG: AarF/ABC1/UbiB kinase family protein [Polyangiaceae bacterium]|nr:AarF/ABC1/UbiB kinase family protein [Polyangiaceae bacterium]
MSDDSKANSTKVPEGRVGRLARLANLGAKTGASMLFRRDADDAAKKAAEVLGTLRGLAAKVGQMAGYIDGLVPEEHRGAYERSMKTLLSAAPTSSPEAVRRKVEEELGAPIDRLFAEWHEAPIASASIGQVHRALLLDGREVAVKVQHPGIVEAVESDLKNAGLVQGAISMLGPRKLESKRVLEEIRTRFREELDYTLEAERQATFARLHKGDPTISIPEIVPERTSKGVLTTEFVRGASLDEAAGAPAAEREAWCRTLWRFVYKGTVIGGMFNADPHPGNYFFQPGGRVHFIDFGCVQPIHAKRRDLARRVHLAAIERNERAFGMAAREMLETRGGEYEERVVAYTRRAFEPQFASPFRITRAYVVSLVEHMKQAGVETYKAKDDKFVPIPEGMLFMNRLQFGFFSVLARLDVEVDYAGVELEFLKPA